MKKINIREALLNIDKRTNAQYDLTTLYEACKLSEEDKKKVVQYIDAKEPPFMIGEFLASKCDAVCESIVGDDEVSEADMKKIVDDINDGGDHTLWALMDKADKLDEGLEETDVAEDTLNEEATIEVDMPELENKIRAAATDVIVNRLGYDEDFALDYLIVETSNTDAEDARVKVEVRADLSYEESEKIADALNPIVRELDKDAYFDFVNHNTLAAYIRLDQSDDVVDEEAFNYWKNLFSGVKTRDDLINIYKQLVAKRDSGSITWGTMDKLFDEVISPLNDKIDAENAPKIEESILKSTSKKLRKEYLLDVFDADEITELAMAYISPRNSKHALSYILKNWDDFYFEDEYSEWLEDNHPEIDTDLEEAAVGTSMLDAIKLVTENQ